MYANFQIYLIPSGEIQLKFQMSDVHVTSKNGLKACVENKGSWTDFLKMFMKCPASYK